MPEKNELLEKAELELGVSRAESLARHIAAIIRENHLSPGQKLGTRADLRQRFGVAPATLNEAIRLLDTSGLVEARPGPGGGVFVAPHNPQVKLKDLLLDFHVSNENGNDYLVIQDALEPLVCLEASQYHTAEDIEELHALVEKIEIAGSDPLAFLQATWALHRCIAEMCRNQPLKNIYLSLLDVIASSVQQATPDGAFTPLRGVALHRRLVEAIESGDAERVTSVVAEHSPWQH